MSKEKTLETQTAHGTVEYEVVECDSCESEVSKNEAKPFFIGSVKSISQWGYRNKLEVEFDMDDVVRGWACPYCYDDEPIDYPRSVPDVSIPRRLNPLPFIVALIVQPPNAVVKEFDQQVGLDEVAMEMLTMMGTLLWGCALLFAFLHVVALLI